MEQSFDLTERVLRGARYLIQRGWCRGTPARDAMGQPTDVTQPDAVSFCLEGALWRAMEDLGMMATRLNPNFHPTMREVRRFLRQHLPYQIPLWIWNDQRERTQEDVLRLLDRAIGGK